VREEVRKMTSKFIECENCEGSGKVEEVEEEEVRKMKINVAYSRTVNLGNFNLA